MPRLSNLEQNYTNVKFVKVDIDNNIEYAQSLGIMSVPTILIYKGTELLNKSIGANVDAVYKNILDTL
jgi:thioredoxin 1